jgi:hypothetical protein
VRPDAPAPTITTSTSRLVPAWRPDAAAVDVAFGLDGPAELAALF